MGDVLNLDLCAAAGRVASGTISPSELVSASLARIEAAPAARACFLRLDRDEAVARADRLDRAGERKGRLHGVPLAHKDIFSLPAKKTTFSAHADFHLEGRETASALAALDSAGAVNIGALHLSEFAMGPAGWSEHYGFLENPRDPSLVTGGSSSGSAAAVARRLVFGALGTDTGGSIRIPAAFCGVVGLKPTWGLVPSFGCFPVSNSLDTIGPLARTVRDCARLLDALVPDRPGGRYERGLGEKRPIRFGVLDPAGLPAAPDTEVADSFERIVAAMGRAGLEVRSVRMDDLAELSALSAVIFLTEAGAEHAARLHSAREKIGPQVAERLLQGLAYPGSLYLLARKARETHLETLRRSVFSQVDVILLPTSPSLPPRRDEYDKWRDTGAILDFNARLGAYTPAFSFLGVPALSLPAAEGAPGFGLQMVADIHRDDILLQAARTLESLWGP
ncbi:amidase [Bosea sp. (in: a-proteobacteria)]